MLEEEIWKILNSKGKKQIDIEWLKTIYSPNQSIELRRELTKLLGMYGENSWEIIKFLLGKYGPKDELIYAAGLSNNKEARDWLVSKIEKDGQLNLIVIKALSCWGASLSKEIIKRILKEYSQEMRLAGLELLSFKAYQLTEKELIEITKGLIDDLRDNIVIATIKIMQKKDGEDICNIIKEIAIKGSEASSKAALQALGSICSKYSENVLLELCETIKPENRRNLAKKQLKHQYRHF